MEGNRDQTQFKIYSRLAQLDEETQERISQKYYSGARPWLKDSKKPRRKSKKAADTQKQEE